MRWQFGNSEDNFLCLELKPGVNKYFLYCRYASCLGEDTRHCDNGGGEVITTTTVPVSTVATFLGIELNSTDAEVALNVQFALLVVFFFFSIAITVAAFKKQRKNKVSDEIYLNGAAGKL